MGFAPRASRSPVSSQQGARAEGAPCSGSRPYPLSHPAHRGPGWRAQKITLTSSPLRPSESNSEGRPLPVRDGTKCSLLPGRDGPPLSSFCQKRRPRSPQGQQKGINHAPFSGKVVSASTLMAKWQGRGKCPDHDDCCLEGEGRVLWEF